MAPFGLLISVFRMMAAHWVFVLVGCLSLGLIDWAFSAASEELVSSGLARAIAGDGFGLVYKWILMAGVAGLWALAAAYFAVLWHRLVLRTEGVFPSLRSFAVYVWYAFLVGLVLLVSNWIMMMPAFFLYQIDFLIFAIYFAFYIVLALYLMLRVGLVLPAAAIGDREMTFPASWYATQGRSLSILVIVFVQMAVVALSVNLSGPLALGGSSFSAIVGLAALSVLYRDAAARTDA